ncbi:MAG TPA: HDIG domain-containing metalloprotein, partial [Ktedonobacterales bacterium]
MALNFDDALALLRAHNTNDSLVRHGIAVSDAMAAYARKFGEDEAKWRVTGLLHDVDYEEHPTIEEHGLVGGQWLAERNYPDDVVHAVRAHNDFHGIARDTLM